MPQRNIICLLNLKRLKAVKFSFMEHMISRYRNLQMTKVSSLGLRYLAEIAQAPRAAGSLSTATFKGSPGTLGSTLSKII